MEKDINAETRKIWVRFGVTMLMVFMKKQRFKFVEMAVRSTLQMESPLPMVCCPDIDKMRAAIDEFVIREVLPCPLR